MNETTWIARLCRVMVSRSFAAFAIVLVIGTGLAACYPRLRVQYLPPTSPVRFLLSIHRPNASVEELRVELGATVEPVLMAAEGVRNVTTSADMGGYYSARIEFDPDIEPEHARAALQEQLATLPPADSAVQTISLQRDLGHPLLLVSFTYFDDLESTASMHEFLATRLVGQLERVEGVGRVELAGVGERAGVAAPPYAAWLNGATSPTIAVFALPEEDLSQVSYRILKRMSDLRETLPAGLQYEVSHDRSIFLEGFRRNIVVWLLAAFGVMLVIVFLFEASWRTLLSATAAVGSAACATLLLLLLLGQSINVLTIAALCAAAVISLFDLLHIVTAIGDDGWWTMFRAAEEDDAEHPEDADEEQEEETEEVVQETAPREAEAALEQIEFGSDDNQLVDVSALTGSRSEEEQEEDEEEKADPATVDAAEPADAATDYEQALAESISAPVTHLLATRVIMLVGLAALAFCGGLHGRFCQQWIIAGGAAVLASTLSLLAITPGVLRQIWQPLDPGATSILRLVQRMGRVASRVLAWFTQVLVHQPALAILAVVGIGVWTYFECRQLGGDLIPHEDQGYLSIDLEMDAASDAASMETISAGLSKKLVGFPETQSIVTVGGYSAIDGCWNGRRCTLFIALTPEMRRGDIRELESRVQLACAGIEDATAILVRPSLVPTEHHQGLLNLLLTDQSEPSTSRLDELSIGALHQASSAAPVAAIRNGNAGGQVTVGGDTPAAAKAVAFHNLAPAAPVSVLWEPDADPTRASAALLGSLREQLPADFALSTDYQSSESNAWTSSTSNLFASFLLASALGAGILFGFAEDRWRGAAQPLVVAAAVGLALTAIALTLRVFPTANALTMQLAFWLIAAPLSLAAVSFSRLAAEERENDFSIADSAMLAFQHWHPTLLTCSVAGAAAMAVWLASIGPGGDFFQLLAAYAIGGFSILAFVAPLIIPPLYVVAAWVGEVLSPRAEDEAVEDVWNLQDAVLVATLPFTLVGHWLGYAGDDRLKAVKRRIQIVTVTGPIRPRDAKTTLTHERLINHPRTSDTGLIAAHAKQAFQSLYDYIVSLRVYGGTTVFDGVTALEGRSPDVLQRLSKATGIFIVTNTGYTAREAGRFVPAELHEAPASDIAKIWQAEAEQGILDTRVKPGFIKIGADPGPLTDLEIALTVAAAEVHLETGLTIASDSPDYYTVNGQLDLLREAGVSANAFIWLHAQRAELEEILLAAGRGAWIQIDNFDESTLDERIALLATLIRQGFADRILLSQNTLGTRINASGDRIERYNRLFRLVIPEMRAARFPIPQIEQITAANPANAFMTVIRHAR